MQLRAFTREMTTLWLPTVLLLLVGLCGCGKTLQQAATEQLLASDAIDKTVEQINFGVLKGEDVYFDTKYINHVKTVGFVNADYIVSSIRQQLIAAGCLLKDKPGDASYIVEARVGALGTDSHELSYGIPASNGLSTAAAYVPAAPAIPAIPEISVAKREVRNGAAKVAVFAYERETGTPVWQSGIKQARSDAKEFWIFGAGPFQTGSVYKKARLAGARLDFPFSEKAPLTGQRPEVAYQGEHYFTEGYELAFDEYQAAEGQTQLIQQAGYADVNLNPPTIAPASKSEPAPSETTPSETAKTKNAKADAEKPVKKNASNKGSDAKPKP